MQKIKDKLKRLRVSDSETYSGVERRCLSRLSFSRKVCAYVTKNWPFVTKQSV